MNESCPECGGKVSGCKWDKSNGMDFESENKHLDGDKAWREFLEYASKEYRNNNRFHFKEDFYKGLRETSKIGLLIEYLKSKGPDCPIYVSGISCEDLEQRVKSLKPVNEVGKLAILLQEHVGTQSNSESTREYMLRIAKEAIEFIKG